jgi:prolyl-tRNA synthetase
MAIGPKDLASGTLEIARRDTKEKKSYPMEGIEDEIQSLLTEIQSNIYNKAQHFKEQNTHQADTYVEFKTMLENKGGFIYAHWDGTRETENKIKEETKATIRCIPLEGDGESGSCMVTGKPSLKRVLFAKAY